MKSIWQETELPKFPSLNGDMHTDVLIIGGGMAGILTAYFLQKNNINYVLVEKERICNGTTRNTTAKITFQHGLIYHKILKNNGIEAAQKYLYAQKSAFDKYAELCQNIDCDYEIKDNYVYSQNNQSKLLSEMKALDKIGYKQVKFCPSLPLPVQTVGAVQFSHQAQFNPLKFISAIVNELNICEHTCVKEMEKNTAVTDKGRIYAKIIIIATHFPFVNKHGSYFLKLYQHRSYVIALKDAEKFDGMYVDECRKGFSFRNYQDFLLLGGGGHRTGKEGGNWNELRSLAQKAYPHAKEKFFWAAQDCMSLDDIPYIGKYSKNTPFFYVESGFNKWGMTSSMAAAMIISDIILGKSNDYTDVFNPSRNIIKPQLLINGFEATKNLLTFSKKRCPHLGCALKWNHAERSWDCPCHGSRFSENGKVLENPANGDLN
ncbi:MAG: FAD-dependent oxidoreductase [Acutalibacteraceae bacterium]